jgi:starch synthase
MRVLSATAEVSPWAKVGGLADVVASLPKALAPLGVETLIALPAYGFLMEELRSSIVQTKTGLEVPLGWERRIHSVVHRVEVDGLSLILIDGEERFKKVIDRQAIYTLGREDWIYFAQAVLRAAEALPWMPDVVHCHDWQMGFLPVMMRERKGKEWDKVASVFTIHNFEHQGVFGIDTLDVAGLPKSLFTSEKIEAFGSVNFLKAGSAYCDKTSTVSPTYAVEITTEERGGALHGLMMHLRAQHRLTGILNGIDVVTHDPQTDPALPAHFSLADPSGKAICRAELLKELGLKGDSGPLCGMVTRLAEQKGLELLLSSADEMIRLGCTIVVQGQGNPDYVRGLQNLAERHPDRFAYVPQFDPDLAQRIYGGSDLFLMPSRYEPCGLGQMFAMRYGTLPIVQYTGGLADTVTEDMTGYTFFPYDAHEFLKAVEKAVLTYQNHDEWARMIRMAMREDFSWTRTAPEYLDLYEDAVKSRALPA